MLKVEEIHVSGAVELSGLHSTIFPRLRRILSLPGFGRLRPLARRIAGVAEAPGRLSFYNSINDITEQSDRQTLTVISANLWHDWPKFRQIYQRMESFAQLVESHQADVLLLQEVARTPEFSVDHWLAERLGMSFVYSRANGHRQGIGFEEGVAIFSRYPLNQPVLRQLSPTGNPFVHRMALGAEVSSPLGQLYAFSVHLGINARQNRKQVSGLRRWVERHTAGLPALVGGDFNAEEPSSSIRELKRAWLDTFRMRNPFGDGVTHEIQWPWGRPLRKSRLDYIFLKAEQKKWQVLEALHLETPGMRHSDHRAVLLRLAPAYAVVERN